MISPPSSLSDHRRLGSDRRKWRPETVSNMDDNNIVVVPAVARRRHRRRVINYAGEFRECVSRRRCGKFVVVVVVVEKLFYSISEGEKSMKTHPRWKKNPKSDMIDVYP